VTSLVAEALLEWLKWMRKIELFERKNDEEVKKEINQIQKEIEQEIASRRRSK
jgi:esterase/lipase